MKFIYLFCLVNKMMQQETQQDKIVPLVIKNEDEEDQVVTPWKAETKSGKFNYKRLIEQFGVEEINEELLDRFKKVTGHDPHPWMKRGLFFAHRQLGEILDDYEKGKPIFLYTGRGPTSEALHLGHIIPFMFTKWLQDVFDAVVVIQMADDEKYYFKDMSFDHIYKLGFENAKDIIAVGFNPEKTFIFSNRDYLENHHYIKVIADFMKYVKINQINATFGIPDSGCVGQMIWPVYQSAAAFSASFKDIFGADNIKCLVAYAIDQDPYFRLCRDVAPRLGFHKPCAIMTQFLPALEGNAKMSSTANTGPVSTIFMTDSKEQIKDKIMKYAYSGGGDTIKEHREKGANLTVDVSYQYLKYFEFDDAKLEDIANKYASGQMLTSEIKTYLVDKVTSLVESHNVKKSSVTPDTLKYFYDLTKFKH